MLRYLERTLIKRGVNAIFARILNVVHILIILFSIFLILDETIDRFSDYRSLRDKIAPGNQEILTILKNMEEGGVSEEDMILVTEVFWNDVYVNWEYPYRNRAGGISTQRYIPNRYDYKPFQVAIVENDKLVIRQSLSFQKWLFIVEEDFYIILILYLSPILLFPVICIILILTLTFLYNYIARGGMAKKHACPNCKNKLETKYSFCPYCAIDLRDIQPDMKNAFKTETNKPNSPKNCPKCNTEVKDNTNFCGSCGQDLRELQDLKKVEVVIVSASTQSQHKLVQEDINSQNATQNNSKTESSEKSSEILKQRKDWPQYKEKESFLSTGGRLRRLYYGLRLLGMFFVFAIILAIAQDVDRWLGFFVQIVFIALTILESSKRFHDINKSGSDAFLLLIPFVNLYYYFYLIFTDGTIGPNEYGPDPKKREKKKSEVEIKAEKYNMMNS